MRYAGLVLVLVLRGSVAADVRFLSFYQFLWKIYTETLAMHLNDLGLSTTWTGTYLRPITSLQANSASNSGFASNRINRQSLTEVKVEATKWKGEAYHTGKKKASPLSPHLLRPLLTDSDPSITQFVPHTSNFNNATATHHTRRCSKSRGRSRCVCPLRRCLASWFLRGLVINSLAGRELLVVRVAVD